ncbi:Uncharacterised protein [Chlamydia abortus]|nr:Uncharacterised protein [Chlamydia abortus]SGA26445.1 Uncharacterised protein [Chlamydia abortus]
MGDRSAQLRAKELQLMRVSCVVHVKVFPDGTHVLSTFPDITNVGFCVLARARSFCGGGPNRCLRPSMVFHDRSPPHW